MATAMSRCCRRPEADPWRGREGGHRGLSRCHTFLCTLLAALTCEWHTSHALKTKATVLSPEQRCTADVTACTTGKNHAQLNKCQTAHIMYTQGTEASQQLHGQLELARHVQAAHHLPYPTTLLFHLQSAPQRCFSGGSGLFATMESISSMTSGVSLSMTSSASRLSSSCAHIWFHTSYYIRLGKAHRQRFVIRGVNLAKCRTECDLTV